jgi:hypothetical protein
MALARVRKVLELLIREAYEQLVGEQPGGLPLECLLKRLVRDDHLCQLLYAHASSVRQLGNVGNHAFGTQVTAADVWLSLSQLAPVVQWFFKDVRPDGLDLCPQKANLVTGPPPEEEPGPAPHDPTPVLEVACGPEKGKTYKLAKDRVVLGRSRQCDIVVCDRFASKLHAQLIRTEDGYQLGDLHSTNGSVVNGRRLSGRHTLRDGDRIHVGDFILVYRSPAGHQPAHSMAGDSSPTQPTDNY